MKGPSADALFWGGQGGALRYDLGTVVSVRISGGGPAPADWRRKSKLQEAFGDYGHILRTDVPEGQGVAFVEFDDKRDAADMVSDFAKGKKVCGCAVIVEIAQSASGKGRSNVHDRVTDLAQKFRVDDSATAQLLRVFAERMRLATCDLDQDLQRLSDHLSSSNKPSALVCKMLGDIRSGKTLGPCRFTRNGPQSGGRTGADEPPLVRFAEHDRSHNRSRSGRKSRDRDTVRDAHGNEKKTIAQS